MHVMRLKRLKSGTDTGRNRRRKRKSINRNQINTRDNRKGARFEIARLTGLAVENIMHISRLKWEVNMEREMFVTADKVAEDFGVSKGYAYRMIRQMNEELKSKGYLTVAGRVSRAYYLERIYGAAKGDEKNACI